jgi:hypothetical protein
MPAPNSTNWIRAGRSEQYSLAKVLARIIHERSVGLRVAPRKTDEYAEKVADSRHYRL